MGVFVFKHLLTQRGRCEIDIVKHLIIQREFCSEDTVKQSVGNAVMKLTLLNIYLKGMLCLNCCC